MFTVDPAISQKEKEKEKNHKDERLTKLKMRPSSYITSPFVEQLKSKPDLRPETDSEPDLRPETDSEEDKNKNERLRKLKSKQLKWKPDLKPETDSEKPSKPDLKPEATTYPSIESGELTSKQDLKPKTNLAHYKLKTKPGLKPNTKSEPYKLQSDPDLKPDRVEIADLLFKKRDYLIMKHARRVTLYDLAGKFLCIYFVPLSPLPLCEYHLDVTRNLIDVHDQLSKTNKDRFEVVFIPTYKETDNDDYYSKPLSRAYRVLLSIMTWPAIPYKDFESRKHACDILGVSRCSSSISLVLIHPNGSLMKNIGEGVFLNTFGADAFPFTDERLVELDHLDQIERSNTLSLETLLSSSVRDFVITNENKKVPISDLKPKTVGLLLYRENEWCNQLADKLKVVYKQHKDDFEVVLIHLYVNWRGTCQWVKEESFWKIFKSMPWLALPFKDPNIRKLSRVFELFHEDELYGPRLIIVKPDGSFERDGYRILERYTIEAYPFTWEKATDFEVAKLKKLKLDLLMKSPGYLLRGGYIYKVSELLGKRVLLLFAHQLAFGRNLLLWTLKYEYCKNKGTEHEFEVVYISMFTNELFYFSCVANLPWLVHPYDTKAARKLVSHFFNRFPWPSGGMGIVAFGPEGHVLAKESIFNGNFEQYNMSNRAFPYIDEDLRFHTLVEIRP